MVALIPQKIVHVELSEDVRDLTPDVGYQAFYVVFWWYKIALGHVEINGDRVPLCANQLKRLAVRTIAPAIASHLQEYGLPVPEVTDTIAQNDFAADDVLREWEEPFANWRKQHSKPINTSISVVICTRDRPEYLAKCLKSLHNLSLPPDQIVVVDNAPSSDATQKLVAQMAGLKYVLEAEPGLSKARNTGISYSKGEIIAFIDDDVIVHPEWTTWLRYCFTNPNLMVATGLVIPAQLETKSQFIFEKYWSFNRGYCSKNYDTGYFKRYDLIGAPSWRIGAGANMAIRRKAIQIVGNFDLRLGAGSSGCSEDSEFWYRVLAEGFICRYEPTAVVYHSHRREMAALHKQLFNYMRGHITELLIRFERYRHFGNLVRLALLPVYFSYLLLFGLRQGKYRYSTILTEISCCLSGFKFYFKSIS